MSPQEKAELVQGFADFLLEEPSTRFDWHGAVTWDEFHRALERFAKHLDKKDST